MAIGSGTNAGSLDLGQARKLATAFGNGRAWFGPGAPWLLKAGLPGPEWFIITPKDEVMKNLKRIALVATATAAAALAPMVTTASADAASVLMVRGTQVWPVYSPGTAEWDSQQTDLTGGVCGAIPARMWSTRLAGILRPRSRRASPLWTPP